MSDASPSSRLVGVRPMLLGIAAILAGGVLAVRNILLYQSGIPMQSPLADTAIKAGFLVALAGFCYGTLATLGE